ncbi:hypothetical protein EDD86DRAFT_205724 [Gorgonomyces haynaldii]|nr:hypothetical protein EDD86DRAFT_205724 [Gorgonomyces haynaldii]
MWLLKTTVVLLCSAFEHMTWTQQLLSESMDLIDWYIYNSQDTDEQLLHNLQLVYLKMSHAPSTIVVFGPAHDTTSFQDLYTRLKLSYSLTFCDFSYHCTKLLPELFNNRNLLIKISKREASEIDHACRFLVSRDKQDVSSASKWFRVSGSAQIRRQMQTNGFGNYSKANKVDAVSASYYIKGILQSINNGLIPSVIRQLLIDLLHPYIDAKSIPTNVIAACYGLLSLHPVKFQILRSLCSVTDRILQEGTLDPISPKDLARVLKVSDDSIYEPLTQTELTPSEMKHINQELDRWNHVFGLILSNSKEFLYQEQYENTLASMSQMLYSQ